MTRKGLRKNFLPPLFVLLAITVPPVSSVTFSETTGNSVKGIPPELVADYLQAIIESDRKVYTTRVVERMQNQEDCPSRGRLGGSACPSPPRPVSHGIGAVGCGT